MEYCNQHWCYVDTQPTKRLKQQGGTTKRKRGQRKQKCKKKNKEKAKSVVIIADTTGGITSKVPSIAACTGFFPFS